MLLIVINTTNHCENMWDIDSNEMLKLLRQLAVLAGTYFNYKAGKKKGSGKPDPNS